MIRKNFMLVLVILLFLYMVWNFYSEALKYDPLSEVSVRKYSPREADIILSSEYSKAWSKEIFEKNLFSPNRTYKNQKAIPDATKGPVEPPQKRPEVGLEGIVLDIYGDYIAYVVIDDSKAIPMRKGDKVENFELFDISERKVMLKWKTEMIQINLDKIKTIKRPGKSK